MSQRWPKDSSEAEASFGKACDLVVAVVRCWIGSWAVAVDVIILPLGTMTWTAGLDADMVRWGKWGVI